LDSAVDATAADLGVEGKVVAGAFEGYCDDGFVWVPGSAKYGTLPGFCVMSDLAKNDGGLASSLEAKPLWTGVSQGEAQVACQSLGTGYHLIGENEWLTMAENILQVADNDMDKTVAGMQLATSSAPTPDPSPAASLAGEGRNAFKLTNDNYIYDIAGNVSEWTNQNVTEAGLPAVASAQAGWSEYSEVMDFKGLNIAPAYYLTDQNNNIGKIYVGSTPGLKGFVRGQGGIYGLDLSHAPAEQAVNIGFRCAK
jgi:formylglycine-generating enzyme required for sulfatase activity